MASVFCAKFCFAPPGLPEIPKEFLITSNRRSKKKGLGKIHYNSSWLHYHTAKANGSLKKPAGDPICVDIAISMITITLIAEAPHGEVGLWLDLEYMQRQEWLLAENPAT